MVSAADIFNRPPAISEDTLQYVLYPPAGMNDKASVTTLATVIRSQVETWLPGFLWHRDPFELKVVADPESEGWLLEGRMRVGDSVDDEWCVVWLMREISSKWDLVISVFDSDGEFLLIEAAEVLPSWVTPTIAENRVWIYNSHLHLIPLSQVSPPSSKHYRREYPRLKDDDDDDIAGGSSQQYFINAGDAVRLVRDASIGTQAILNVEQTVWSRIAGYPSAARQHVHITNAWLPVDIARALSANPSLVQKPVETFYTRDTIQLRAAYKMARFPPEPSVLRSIKITRTAYAQLMGQKFHAPKIFGRWQEKEDTRQWKWRDIGMKIACGFEMLYQESKSRKDAISSPDVLQASAEARKDALRRNSDYTKYIQNLVSAGYFKGEQEGSQLWNTLEDKAAMAFIEARREDDATRPSFASLISNAVSEAGSAPIESTQEEEDSDAWLNIDNADLDDMLEQKLGASHKNGQTRANTMYTDTEGTEEDRVSNEQASRLESLAKKVEDFVEGEGDIAGAKFVDEASSDEEFSDENFSDSDDEDESSGTEPSAADTAARQTAMDKLVPGIDPSEYGKMPASFHSNSQKVAKTTIETDAVEEISTEDPTLEHFRKSIRPPILPRDVYEGVDSDDETDEEDDQDEEDQEDQPQVVGEVEINMEEEQDEFIEFSRQALGISDEQWHEILRDRKQRGAFVPTSARVDDRSSAPITPSTWTPAATSEAKKAARKPAETAGPGPDPNLDSFEAVMQAMDAQLASVKSHPLSASDKGKGKAKDMYMDVDDGMNIEEAMDAELKAAMEHGDLDADEALENGGSMDYNLIKNFLESFKSQAGLSGPVSNLAGRLDPGWKLPRDTE